MPSVPVVVTDVEVARRRRLGIDKRDERWEGEWHLVNPPKNWHADMADDLLVGLRPWVERRGLRLTTVRGLFAADDDWRIPDLMAARRSGGTFGDAGLAAAELVVEVRSPGDDSYRKLPFYGRVGVREVWIVHRDRRVELYRRGPDGELALVPPSADGSIRSEVLGVTLATVEGPRLRIADAHRSTDV